MLRVVIVGAGNITQSEHLPNWRSMPGVEVVALADRRLEVARAVGQAYGIPWYSSLEEALGAVDADAVHVTSTLLSHVPLVQEATARGLHVMVEKPLAEWARDGEAAVRAARQAGVVLDVGYQKQADADVAYVTDLVHGGRLGALMGVHSVFRISQAPLYRRIGNHPREPFLPPAAGETSDLHTRLLDQSIHHLNVFHTWVDGELEFSAVRRGGALWSLAGGSVDGRVAVTHINAAESGHGEEFWAYFERGSVHVTVWSPHFPATAGSVEVVESAATTVYRPVVPRRNPYLVMLERFVDRIAGRLDWIDGAQRAVDDLRLVRRIEEVWSAASGEPAKEPPA